MNAAQQRMQLSARQNNAVIMQDDHGVPDPAPLFVMDLETWIGFEPHNFFNYFVDNESVASTARWKALWQRYQLLHNVEAQVLTGVMRELNNDTNLILKTPSLAERYHQAYQDLTGLVDELDTLIDRDLRPQGRWNHGYVLNENLVV